LASHQLRSRPSDAGPTEAGLLAGGSLATGRSRVGRACVAPLLDCQAAKASSRKDQVMVRGDFQCSAVAWCKQLAVRDTP